MGQLDMTETLAGHLDGCLSCRACERVCPSLVAYGRLTDGAKTRRVAALPGWRRTLRRSWLSVLSDGPLNRAMAALARAYRSSGLMRLIETSRLVQLQTIRTAHRLATAIGVSARPPRSGPRSPTDFDLFVGCLGSTGQGAAIEATRLVCERIGLRPRLPDRTECCGAMLHHNGYPSEADARRRAAAERHRGRTLVGLSSACIAELREENGLRETEELCAFLDRQHWPDGLALRPLLRRVLIHEPCSHRNQLGGNGAVYRLLARIPQLQVMPLPGNGHCCGGAGTYLLQQPAMANALLTAKLAPVRTLNPDIIVTTNLGCWLQLIAGVREAGLDIEVCHPIELIARQMPD